MKHWMIIARSAACALVGLSLNAFASADNAIQPELVDTLLAPYFAMQKGLAADDLTATKKGADLLSTTLKAAPSKEAGEALSKIRKEIEEIHKASDLKIARKHFLTVSNELTEMLSRIGTTGKTDVYKVFCPMAFDSAGGGWLQDDTTVANPYYGAGMLRCGSVQEHLIKKGNQSGEKEKK